MVKKPCATLNELALQFGGEVLGDGNTQVGGINTLEKAVSGEISFLSNSRYKKLLTETSASAVILGEFDRDAITLPRLVVANPYLYFARITGFFHPPVKPQPGIHPSAVIEPGAKISSTASIGAFAYIAEDVVIGEHCIIRNHASIGRGVVIGDETQIHARVVIYDNCEIGKRVILHAGVVIGADGFGLAPHEGKWIKIPQVGKVILHDDVEVGANTTIDRGALDNTVIEEGVKLDNQIQIGHNVHIGAHTAIAGCAGVAGSAKIGRHCTIGGSAGISGHIEICDNVHISAFTLITKSIKKAGQYTSQLPMMTHQEWLKSASHLRKLDVLVERVKALNEPNK